MRRLLLPALFCAFAAVSLLPGCASESLEELAPTPIPCDSTVTATYAAVIRPIFNTNCLECHDGTGPNAGRPDYRTYAGIKIVADNGLLVGVITHAPGFSKMPKDRAKLPDCEIAKIKQWVRAGALDN